MHLTDFAGGSHRAALVELHENAALLAGFGAWQCDLRDNSLTWTNGVYDLFGLPRGSALERSAIVDLYGDESRRQMERLRSEAIRTGGSFSLDARIFPRAGEARWMRLIARTETMLDGSMRLFGSKQDVTAEYALLDRLRAETDRDPQTGLASRRHFERVLQQAIDEGFRHRRSGSLTLIDARALPEVNARFGSAATDACLRDIATRLMRAADRSAIISRFSEHEFALLQQSSPAHSSLRQDMARLSRIIRRPFFWGDHCIDYGITTGTIALDTSSSTNAADLLGQARTALIAAKPGKGTGPSLCPIDDPQQAVTTYRYQS